MKHDWELNAGDQSWHCTICFGTVFGVDRPDEDNCPGPVLPDA